MPRESIPVGDDPFRTEDGEPEQVPMSRIERRRQRIRNEIERNRRGEYSVPTWVLAAILVAVLLAWAALIAFG